MVPEMQIVRHAISEPDLPVSSRHLVMMCRCQCKIHNLDNNDYHSGKNQRSMERKRKANTQIYKAMRLQYAFVSWPQIPYVSKHCCGMMGMSTQLDPGRLEVVPRLPLELVAPLSPAAAVDCIHTVVDVDNQTLDRPFFSLEFALTNSNEYILI